MRSFEISAREAGQRMDKYLLRMLSAASPGFVYKMLRKKNIVLNGRKAAGSEILREGDEVRLYLSEETFTKFAPAFAGQGGDGSTRDGAAGDSVGAGGRTDRTRAANDAGIDIVYEDDDILIVNKPSGLLSQKAGPDDDSANDRIIAYLVRSGQITPEELATFHPSICNRLDRNTSGLLIAGKTMRGLQETAELLRGRELKKYYHALVRGIVEEERHLSGYLVKDEQTNTVRITEEPGAADAEDSGEEKPGDPGAKKKGDPGAQKRGDAVETAYRPLAYYGDATLLEVHLITGRSHQIRAHLASTGHPVLGDRKYGDAALNRALKCATGIEDQLLCACRMEFPDGLVVKIPDPESFAEAEEWLARSAPEHAAQSECTVTK